MKILVVLFTLLSVATTFAAEGTASFRLSGSGASYDLTLENGKLTGSSFGFGNTSGKVELEKKDGLIWVGHWGLYQIKTTPVDNRRPNIRVFEINMFPGGIANIRAEYKGNNLYISGTVSNSFTFTAGMENNDSIFAGNQVIQYSLSANGHEAGLNVYRGSTIIPRRPFNTVETTLKASGALDIVEAAKDPVIFTLLYVLPYNLFRK